MGVQVHRRPATTQPTNVPSESSKDSVTLEPLTQTKTGPIIKLGPEAQRGPLLTLQM